MSAILPFQATGAAVDANAGMQTSAKAGRRDGRQPGEMRSITASQGLLTRADGSARLRIGNTDLLVAVYGPMNCAVHRQNAERAALSVTFRHRETGQDSTIAGKEALAARELRNVLSDVVMTELYPRKAIVVAVQVLSDCGGVLAAAFNAAILAMIDAAVPLVTVPTAASVSIHNATLVVDPVRVEQAEAEAVLTFTFDTALAAEKGFMSVYTEGDCAGDHVFAAAVNTARQLAQKTRAFLKLSLERKASLKLIWHAS